MNISNVMRAWDSAYTSLDRFANHMVEIFERNRATHRRFFLCSCLAITNRSREGVTLAFEAEWLQQVTASLTAA